MFGELWGMREEWVEDPVRGYEENARHLLGYPACTVREYVRDLRQFEAWVSAGDEADTPVAQPAGGRPNPAAGAEAGASDAADHARTAELETGRSVGRLASGEEAGSTRPASGSATARSPVRPAGGRLSDDRSSPPAVGRGVRLLAVTREEVEGWVVRLSDRGLRATTINRKLASLKGYASYCISLVITDTWSTGCSIADPQLSAGFKNILSLTRMLSIKP
jgi:hypothetical protein